MSMAKREMDRLENVVVLVRQLAEAAGAIRYDSETDEVWSECDEEAEKAAYGRVTNAFKRGEIPCARDLPEVRAALADLLANAPG